MARGGVWYEVGAITAQFVDSILLIEDDQIMPDNLSVSVHASKVFEAQEVDLTLDS